MSLADLTISEAGRRLRDGTMSSIELAEAHLTRIAILDPELHAFSLVTSDRALADASRADTELAEQLDRGPLHGIPVGLKDLIDTAGIATTYGSRRYGGHVPRVDAEVVRRLGEAGAVLIGKLQTYEFAVVGPSFDLPMPAATNPWNIRHITGGSSSGSAAAVAGGLLRTAIGSDTGGSIRSPSSYCGAVGLKPTFGRVSRHGVFPLSPSLDHVGPISASVAEAAITFDAISGYDQRDADSLDEPASSAASGLNTGVEGLSIGYARDWFASDLALAPGVLNLLDDAMSMLSLLGARIHEVTLPDYPLLEAAGAVILQAEAFAIHRNDLAEHAGDYGRLAYESLAAGLVLSDDDVAVARHAASLLKWELDAVLAHHDAIATITTLGPAPPFSAFDGKSVVWTAMRTLPFNLTGHPVLSVPVGYSGGLPIGMQIVGRRLDEAMVCRIGDAFERATDSSAARPPFLARARELAGE
jgi:aspartyl-tRNA(Asn)/glutamyl-tRNA(Gln) amidotransferase subunit A